MAVALAVVAVVLAAEVVEAVDVADNLPLPLPLLSLQLCGVLIRVICNFTDVP